jgi:hypothetical protein
MEALGELQGEKWVVLKPPIDPPTIAWSREVHNPRSYREKELALTRQNLRSAF